MNFVTNGFSIVLPIYIYKLLIPFLFHFLMLHSLLLIEKFGHENCYELITTISNINHKNSKEVEELIDFNYTKEIELHLLKKKKNYKNSHFIPDFIYFIQFSFFFYLFMCIYVLQGIRMT